MPALLKTMRPAQWVKNAFLFSALIFARQIGDPAAVLRSLGAFVAFCLVSSCVYVLNDLLDIEKDRLHPLKRHRPLAAGVLSVKAAILLAVLLLVAGGVAGALLGRTFAALLAGYFVLQALYGWRLKHVVILDVFAISAGFVIRVVAGAVVIGVEASPWLLICTILLALFLALSKRRHELVILEEDAARHRPVLREYSSVLLDQMISVATSSTLIAYCLYTLSPETVLKFGTSRLVFTVPFVLYGILRYLYLVHQKEEGGSPESLLLKDKPLLVSIVLWLATAMTVIYVWGGAEGQ